jgi:hypothetical protein
MREFVFSVIDLNNKAWPLLLDVDRPVQHLLPGLVDSTGMPRQLNYVLVPKGMEQALDGKYSLAQYRIPGGAQLYLRPLRDELLKQLLDKLYDEVKDEIKSQLFDAAKEKLKQILNIDPSFPDLFKLKDQLFGSPQLINSNLPAQPAQPVQSQYQSQYQQSPKPHIGTGWIIAGVLAGGSVLLVGGAVVLFFLYKILTATPVIKRIEPVLGTGDVQVTLRWDAPVDLDLHVIDPSGEEISYSNRISSSGGNLDVDANAGCSPMMTNPVENVFWPTGGAPSGQYQVSVVYYMDCGYSSPVSYTVTIKQNNQPDRVLTGTITQSGETRSVTSFTR